MSTLLTDMPPEEADRYLSVSRETLETVIENGAIKLELSLRKYIGGELEKKASTEALAALTVTVEEIKVSVLTRDEREMIRRFGQGEFTPAQRAILTEIAEGAIDQRTNAGWTKRERVIASMGVLFGICTIILSSLALAGVPG